MHQPRPYGRFAEQAELSDEDAAAVELLARRLTNFKNLSDLDTLKLSRELPSGRIALAIDAGGVFRVVILERHEAPEHEQTGLAETNIPMLFSGAITAAQVLTGEGVGEGVGIRLTEQTRRRIARYDPNKPLPPKDVQLKRFVIEYAPRFDYFKPKNTGIYTFTQYVKQRPTWYSGAMAEVMQVVGGYGQQDMAKLPKDGIERAQFLIPEKWMKKIRRELGNTRLPGYSGFPDVRGEFQCDYKHASGNGVSFDSKGKPWLLRIGPSGVYAMPLPLVPATTTKAFRAYMEEVGDGEILKLLDRFGGMPTGENFPEGKGFEAWRRAGVVIKVCDIADFYAQNAYFAASGWSLNSRGTEAFNTCWGVDGSGLKQSYGYKMKLALDAVKDEGKLPASWKIDDPVVADQLNAYLGALYKALSGTGARELAIKYKIRRQDGAAIAARVGRDVQAEIRYWDSLEAAPIAAHSGSVSRVTSGPIYWAIRQPTSNGRLKFPELTGMGVESFDLHSPDYDFSGGGVVRCDTVVFGCYVDDELQTIKYFIDERKSTIKKESTFEPMMVLGSWDETVTTGLTGLMGYFYTSSFDDRQAAPPMETYTKITGSDMGYGEPAWSTPPILYRVGGLARARYYTHKVETRNKAGFGLDVGVCVPVFSRDCILYAYADGSSERSETVETFQYGMADPTSYELWTHDELFHWMGSTRNGNKGGPPYPREGWPVYLDTMNYNPTEYSDFADSGDWLPLSGAVLDVSGVVGQYTSRNGATHHAGGVTIGGRAPGFEKFYSQKRFDGEQSGRLHVSMKTAGNVLANSEIPHSWYFAKSPTENGDYFYRDAVHVTIGDAEYASIYEKDAAGLRKRWGHTTLVDHKGATHFIGVINE